MSNDSAPEDATITAPVDETSVRPRVSRRKPKSAPKPKSEKSDEARAEERRQRLQERLETQVEVLMVLPGNFGGNNAPMYIRKTDPAKAPGMHLLVIDTDRRLLQSRFSFKDPNLSKWKRSGRLHLLQLKRGQAQAAAAPPKELSEGDTNGVATDAKKPVSFKRNESKMFGAGGIPEAGRRAVKASSGEISQLMEGKDLILSWVGAGGGTGTAVAEEVNELAKAKNLPLITLLTMPTGSEGVKIAIADGLRLKLRDYSRIMVFENDKTPDEVKRNTPSEVIAAINASLDSIFRHYTELTQREGTTSNADFADLLSLLEPAVDLYGGSYDAQLRVEGEGKDKRVVIPDVETAKVVDKVMGHLYQDPNIRAAAMIVVFVGPWTYKQQEEIISGLKNKVQGGSDMFIKVQSREALDEMWVSVIISGAYPEPPASSGSPKSLGILEKTGNGGGRVSFTTIVDGRRRALHVPLELVQRWRAEWMKHKPDEETVRRLREEFARYGPVPDNRAPDQEVMPA